MALMTKATANGRRSTTPVADGGTDVPVSNALMALLTKALSGMGYELRKKEPTKSFVEFCHLVRCTKRNDATAYEAQQKLEKVYQTDYSESSYTIKSAMGETSGLIGGYLVPRDYTPRLLDAASEASFIYPRATVLPMTAPTMECPKPNAETTPAAAGTAPWFGGLLFTWGASQAPAETEPTFGNLMLTSWDLLGYSTVSNQFLNDIGPQGEDYLIKLFGRAAAWYAEYAFLRGSGSGLLMPLGVLNAPCLVTTTRNTSSHVKQVDVAAMSGQMLPQGWLNAVWACSPTALVDIAQVTNYFMNVPCQQGEGHAGYLLSKPLYVTDKLPAIGTQGDLIYFDPSLYIIGDRMEVLIDVSDQTLFQTQQTVFRIWLRLDGKPLFSGAITLPDLSTKVSSCVALK